MSTQTHVYSPTEHAIMNYLHQRRDRLPVCTTAPQVEWIYTNRHGAEYGITNPMAQAIQIISERCHENGEGGTLRFVQGRNFTVNHQALIEI